MDGSSSAHHSAVLSNVTRQQTVGSLGMEEPDQSLPTGTGNAVLSERLTSDTSTILAEPPPRMDDNGQHPARVNASATDAKSLAMPLALSSSAATWTCADQLQRLCSGELMHIISFSHAVDTVLSGGIPLGQVTEISSMPGLGKSQFCFQLAIDVQVPRCCGGVAGEALYFDCDASFSAMRCADLASGCLAHLRELAVEQGEAETLQQLSGLSVESMLSAIHVQSVSTYTDFLALLHQVQQFLHARPQIKLLVVDSLASVFRHSITDYALRSRLLCHVMQALLQVAHRHQIAVVVTNHIVIRFAQSKRDNVSYCPALGDSWGHGATNRLLLEWDDTQTQRLLTVLKSATVKPTSVPFMITADGIRDVQL